MESRQPTPINGRLNQQYPPEAVVQQPITVPKKKWASFRLLRVGPSISISASLTLGCTGFAAAGGLLMHGTIAACQIARGVDQCEM